MPVTGDAAQIEALIALLAQGIEKDMQLACDGAGSTPGETPGAKARWAVVGIRSRGDVLARRLAEMLPFDAVGTLDITLYRDDLSEIGPQPVVRTSEIDFDINGMEIVLIDDVLMTGRSIRAALQSLMDLGRPKRVRLGVLVDRGGRELPICPDYVAMTYHAEAGERVDVHLMPTDDRDEIMVRKQEASS